MGGRNGGGGPIKKYGGNTMGSSNLIDDKVIDKNDDIVLNFFGYTLCAGARDVQLYRFSYR